MILWSGMVPGQTEERTTMANKARKISIRENAWGNWAGYISGKHATYFFAHQHGDDQQTQAEAWLRDTYAAEVQQVYGSQLARLAQGSNRTVLEVDTQDALLAHALVAAAEAKQLPVLATPVEKGRATRTAWIRVTVRAAEWDIEVSGVGDSVVLFAGHSEQGIDWLGEHLHVESWQRLGRSIGVEHRYAGAIVHGAADAGLRVRVL
jgi:hypothetical protein